MTKFSELISMSAEQLKLELEKSLLELHNFRLEKELKKLKSTHKIKLTKKRIAMLKTALRQIDDKNVGEKNSKDMNKKSIDSKNKEEK